jgi:uncharacterized protein
VNAGHADHEQALAQFRAEKDAFFQNNPHAPLTPEQRQAFRGLSYYPWNPALRLERILDRDVGREVVVMDTSTGDPQEYMPAGKIHFKVNGVQSELTIYTAPNGSLFLPMRDATSGNDTYGAGRYLEPEMLDGGRVLVDFNYLYNPYCAYNENWSCPLPPRENWLSVPIEAGEKSFH